MDRRSFLSRALVASGVALVPGVVLAGTAEDLVIGESHKTWPGLNVRCLDLVTDLQHGFVFYLEHPSDEAVRYVAPLCVMDAQETGRFLPEIAVSDCRPEYQERITKLMAWRSEELVTKGRLTEEELLRFGMPRRGKLVREKVRVQVDGPPDILARFDRELPKGWERRPTVPADVAATLLAATRKSDVPWKETEIMSRYFYRHQTQAEIALALNNSQAVICYRMQRGLEALSPLQKARVLGGLA